MTNSATKGYKILPSRGGDWKPGHTLFACVLVGILPSRGGDWKLPCLGVPVFVFLILPSRGGDWKPAPNTTKNAAALDPPLAGR